MAVYVKSKSAWMGWLLIPLVLCGLALQVWFASMLLVGEAWMTRGQAAQMERRPDIAVDAYERAYSWNPHDQNVLYLIGVLRWQFGNKQGAVGALSEALELAPNEINTLIPYAEQLALSGDLQQAERAIRYALDLAPGNWRAEQVAGVVYGLHADHAAAAAHFERAVKLATNPGAGLFNQLSNALYEQGDPERAIHFADRAVRVQPLHADHHMIRGKALLALDRPEEAAKALGWAERVYRNHPDKIENAAEKLIETRRHLVRARIAQKWPNRAVEVLAELAASTGPTNEVTQLAEELGERLNTVEGNRDSAAQFNLGKVMTIVGDYEAANMALARASSGLPHDDQIACAVLRVQVLIELGRPEEALTLLRVLAEADRVGTEYRIAYGDALAASGDTAAARLQYENALQDPSLSDDLRGSVEAIRDALPDQ